MTSRANGTTLARLRGVLRRPGDKQFNVTRQFIYEGHVYASSEEHARAIIEGWSLEDFDRCIGSGHIDIKEEANS